MTKPTQIIHSRAFQVLGVLALAALTAYLTADLWLPAIGDWLAMPATADLRRADVIIVHGGNPRRTDYGIALYWSGLAPKLWHTSYDYRQELTTLVVVSDGGVPEQAFRYLVTTSTWSDGHEIAAAIRAQNVKRVIIVTDWWHSRRALCSTEQQLQGYDVAIEFAPSPSPASPDGWWRNATVRKDVLSELVKFVYYALRYRMNPWGC